MKDVYYFRYAIYKIFRFHLFEWRKPSVIDPSLPDLKRRGKIIILIFTLNCK